MLSADREEWEVEGSPSPSPEVTGPSQLKSLHRPGSGLLSLPSFLLNPQARGYGCPLGPQDVIGVLTPLLEETHMVSGSSDLASSRALLLSQQLWGSPSLSSKVYHPVRAASPLLTPSSLVLSPPPLHEVTLGRTLITSPTAGPRSLEGFNSQSFPSYPWALQLLVYGVS